MQPISKCLHSLDSYSKSKLKVSSDAQSKCLALSHCKTKAKLQTLRIKRGRINISLSDGQEWRLGMEEWGPGQTQTSRANMKSCNPHSVSWPHYVMMWASVGLDSPIPTAGCARHLQLPHNIHSWHLNLAKVPIVAWVSPLQSHTL